MKVATEFGASGLLRESIENGEKAHIFASADVGHPTRLADRAEFPTVDILVGIALCYGIYLFRPLTLGRDVTDASSDYRNARR